MGAYMYPILIKKEPQKVGYTKEFDLDDDVLTLAKLRKYVRKHEHFHIHTDEGIFHNTYTLCVSGTRLETPQEVSLRVAKEELYMENYKAFHLKYDKKS